MNQKNRWLEAVQNEIRMAEQARSSGNEGMARVCARRAAGHALGEYFKRRGEQDLGPSAINRLNHFINTPGISLENKQRAYHLTLRVTENHQLPVDTDLIAETKALIRDLLEVEI